MLVGEARGSHGAHLVHNRGAEESCIQPDSCGIIPAMNSRLWSPVLRWSLRLGGPLQPNSGSRGVVETREGIARGACERLNLHRTASAGPAASFNLRLSEILPGPSEDSGMILGEDLE